MKLQPPEVMLNVYRDLRDRRLLSIAIVLVVAIIAVPILLGGGDDAPLPPASGATPPVPADGVEQLDPVVVSDVPGLRDFHERLSQYRSRDPFKQQLTSPGPTGAGAGGGANDPSGGLPTQETAPSVTSSTDPGTTLPTTVGGDPSVPSETPPIDSGNTDEGGSGGTDAVPSTELITYRLDVRVGLVGKTRVERDVEQLSFLPDAKHPIVEYVEANDQGTKAAFLVNRLAAPIKGDGKCVKSRSDCQYMLLESGQEMYFLFDDRQYRIELKGINEHREAYDPQETGSSGHSGSPGNRPSGRGLSGLLGD